MNTNRRNFLKATAGLATLGAASGYKDMLSLAATFRDQGERALDSVYGNAAQPEYSIQDGKVNVNDQYLLANTMCNGCTTHCGVRVKIDKSTGKVIRVTGNPYNPLSTNPWLDYDKPLKDSFAWVSSTSDKINRSTVCARGNSVFDKIDDHFRVLTPLKRVGKRGENKWQPISLEQALKEIVEGGNLFGEGQVDGLAAIRDIKTPIDPQNPDYGPKSQQLACIGAVDDGRQNFVVQRFLLSFGSKNMANHMSICGLSMRAGSAAFLGDFEGYPHLKPDFDECEFVINWGTAPGQAGNPFKLMGKLLANSRSEKNLRYATITPVLTNSDSIAASDRSTWIPVKPQGDLALAMGMIRWIIENKRYNADYLSIPSAEAMKQAKEGSFSNASCLVVVEKNHPLEGKFLFQPTPPAKEGDQPGKNYYCLDAETGDLRLTSETIKAKLLVDQTVTLNGQSIAVKSSFKLLEEAAMTKTLHEYSEISGVPLKDLIWLADEFTSHGRKVGLHCHGGTMHTTGFYTTYAILTLTALVGAVGYKGGMSTGGGKFRDWQGSRYDLFAYPDKPRIPGIRLDRTRTPYEQSSEYKRKKALGNPYPATDQWYPFTNSVETEFLNSAINGYPYRLKALLLYNASFIYGTSGSQFLLEKLKDPQASIPLIVSVDPFINETSQVADYIIPDSVMYEMWGSLGPWHGTLTKASVIRYPVVEPRTQKTTGGEPICLDSFLIELGKALKLPGFGEKAIRGMDGKWYPLNKPEDVYLRIFENIALDSTPVPDISDEELALSGLAEWRSRLETVCGANWRKVAYVMARGGRYDSKSKSYEGALLSRRYPKALQIYNEVLGNTRNALTGEQYIGTPAYYSPRFTDGTPLFTVADKSQYPLLAFSYKSHIASAASAASEQIREIRYTNYIELNTLTGSRLGINTGDSVKVSSPHGSVTGICRLRQGIHPESIGIEHGFGRFGEGATDVTIGDKTIKLSKSRAAGAWINQLGMYDPCRTGQQPLADFACGSNARQAIPVKIEKA